MRANLLWLAFLLTGASLYSPPTPHLKFGFEVGNNGFYQAHISLDEKNQFYFKEHGCTGGCQCQGQLTVEEADEFIEEVEARFRGRLSTDGATDRIWTDHLDWQGSMNDADRRWWGTTWCSRHPAILEAQRSAYSQSDH